MRRRDLLLLAAGTAVTRNPALAETPAARIGFVQVGSRQESGGLLDAFREGLAALGWNDGSNIAVLDRWAEERAEQLPGIVKELIGFGVALLVTAGTPATLAAARATATIPIVMIGVDDPVALGVVASLAQPRAQRHGPVSDLLRADRKAVAAAAGARPPAAPGGGNRQGRSRPRAKAAGHPQ